LFAQSSLFDEEKKQYLIYHLQLQGVVFVFSLFSLSLSPAAKFINIFTGVAYDCNQICYESVRTSAYCAAIVTYGCKMCMMLVQNL
jgi:hypothetical protein